MRQRRRRLAAGLSLRARLALTVGIAYGAWALMLVVRRGVDPHPALLLGGSGLLVAVAGFFTLDVFVIQPLRRLAKEVELNIDRPVPTTVSADGPAEVAAVAAAFNSLLEARRRHEEELADQVVRDPLTGLGNRSLVDEQLRVALHRARRDRHPVAVLYCDLDEFKDINDGLGHHVGDAVLSEVAVRMMHVVRPGDVVGRLGGDEFVVVAEGLGGGGDAVAMAERVRDAVAAPMHIEGTMIVLTCSVGVATATDADAASLLRDADVAMYRAKRAGRDRVMVHDQRVGVSSESSEIVVDLRRGVSHGEIEVHYQPIIDLATGRVRSLEALARWRHPRRGVLAAAEFVEVAGESGAITDIGAAVLHQVCRDAERWRRDGRAVSVAVNISTRELQTGDVSWIVAEALAESRLDPMLLWLELTDEAVARREQRSGRELATLRELGVHLALDHLRLEAVSLPTLVRYPIEAVKIDGELVARLTSSEDVRTMVEATVAMATALGLVTTACGVQDADVLAVLHELGCTGAQGFLFAPPAPACMVPDLLDEHWTVNPAIMR